MAGHEPNRPRGGLKAERAGICACFPDAGSKEFPHYFQRDFTKYFWSSDYTDDVLDPACDLGVPEPMASLGSLISSGYQNFTSHPYMIVFPLIVMGLLMLCFNMLADGLRDALDPKMKDM